MDIGDCVGDSFDFEVSPLNVDRSLRSSYNNIIMNNKTMLVCNPMSQCHYWNIGGLWMLACSTIGIDSTRQYR